MNGCSKRKVRCIKIAYYEFGHIEFLSASSWDEMLVFLLRGILRQFSWLDKKRFFFWNENHPLRWPQSHMRVPILRQIVESWNTCYPYAFCYQLSNRLHNNVSILKFWWMVWQENLPLSNHQGLPPQAGIHSCLCCTVQIRPVLSFTIFRAGKKWQSAKNF